MNCLRAAWLLLMGLVALLPQFAGGAEVDEVRRTVDAMNAWIGDDENAQAWRKYLLYDRLQQQMELAEAADLYEVVQVLNRFRQPIAELELPQFVAVRDALTAWSEQLSGSPSDELAASPNGTAAQTVASPSPAKQTVNTRLVSLREQLANSIEQVPYRPITRAEIEAARQRARAAAARLDTILQVGSAANRAAWHRFLKWNDLQTQLKPDTPLDTELLGQILGQLYNGDPGLELPEYVDLRTALMALRRLAMAQEDPEIQKLVREQLERVREALPEPTTAEVDRIGGMAELATRLEWLEQLNQAPELVANVRAIYDQPNLVVSASEEAVSAGFTRPVSEVSPVDQVILGTRIRGTAMTEGVVTASLVPHPDSAHIQLCLSTQSFSNTVGRQKPVTIYSNGITRISANTLVVLDEVGLRAMPSQASATTNNRIRSIQPDGHFGRNLVRKIAWKRALQQQPLAERISARNAAREAEQRLAAQVLERIAASNTRLRQQVRQPLDRRNLYPRRLRFRTTDRLLHIDAVQALPSQLAAASSPPSAPEHAVTIQVHESLVLNSAANGLGGITITDERAQELVKELTGSVPEELQLKQDEDPWSITFDVQQPLLVEFHDGKLTIAIQARRFTRGEQVVRQVTKIAATYKVAIRNGRIHLQREGDIDVTYPDRPEGQRLSFTELRNKTFMTNKFDSVFKPEITAERTELPQNWAQLQEMQLVYASSNQGWLSLGWEKSVP